MPGCCCDNKYCPECGMQDKYLNPPKTRSNVDIEVTPQDHKCHCDPPCPAINSVVVRTPPDEVWRRLEAFFYACGNKLTWSLGNDEYSFSGNLTDTMIKRLRDYIFEVQQANE